MNLHKQQNLEQNLLYHTKMENTSLVNLLLRTRKQHKNLPPSPLSLPITRHFHLLRQPIHRTLEALSPKYGPVFSLSFGSRRGHGFCQPSSC